MARVAREELLRFSGADGAPAFVAYKEKIYGVSKSFHWKMGAIRQCIVPAKTLLPASTRPLTVRIC